MIDHKIIIFDTFLRKVSEEILNKHYILLDYYLSTLVCLINAQCQINAQGGVFSRKLINAQALMN